MAAEIGPASAPVEDARSSVRDGSPARRGAPVMGRVLGALVVLASVVVAVAWWTGMPLRLPALHPDDGVAAPQAHGHYQCAMHPQIVSDRPGSCPICGMKLVFVADDAAVSGGAVPVQGPVTESPPVAPKRSSRR
jgi:hypothetical protein